MASAYNPREDHGDDFLSKLFYPDTLVDYEYLEVSRRQQPIEPEKHLMQAILEDAVNTYRLYLGSKSGRQRRLFIDAQRWFWARNDDWPFSFESICAVLGLDPNFLRSGLRRLKEQHEDNQRTVTPEVVHYPALRRTGRL